MPGREKQPEKHFDMLGLTTVVTPLRRVMVPILAERRLWTTPREACRDAGRRKASKLKPKHADKGHVPAQRRLNFPENRFESCPTPQSSPKTFCGTPKAAWLPETKPIRAFCTQMPRGIRKLIKPTRGSTAVCQKILLRPLPHRKALPIDMIHAILNKPSRITLKRNAERGKKTDGNSAGGVLTANCTNPYPYHLRNPDLPRISAFVFRKEISADRTELRPLCLNVRMIRSIHLNTAGEVTY